MQTALQAFVDNSLSKTVNFPAGATLEDVAQAYELAWKLGAKGITVYITGSREKVVLETHAEASKKSGTVDQIPQNGKETPVQMNIWHNSKKPRPKLLSGFTHTIETPLGKAFITINENGGHQPFEVFLNTAKAGSDTAAVSEAIGRLISYILRLSSPVEPIKRLNAVADQLEGIGGGRPMGFGPNRVRSLPDGISQVLQQYLKIRQEVIDAEAFDQQGGTQTGRDLDVEVKKPEPAPGQQFLKIGDLCPECGAAAFISEEGCRKCYACGYSEC